MSIPVRCTGCRSLLKLSDALAGKKVKCPKCKTVLPVPKAEPELVEVAVEEEPRAKKKAAPPRVPTGRTGRVQREEPAPVRKQKVRVELNDEPPPLAPSKRKAAKASKYKPCPNCGAEGARRVQWTSWGSFYGPKLLTHVQCPECSYCYNGKTGRSNAIAASLFVLVPLLGILGILAGLPKRSEGEAPNRGPGTE
jgi:LSD1 subclass zinc finger protein